MLPIGSQWHCIHYLTYRFQFEPPETHSDNPKLCHKTVPVTYISKTIPHMSHLHEDAEALSLRINAGWIALIVSKQHCWNLNSLFWLISRWWSFEWNWHFLNVLIFHVNFACVGWAPVLDLIVFMSTDILYHIKYLLGYFSIGCKVVWL